MPLLTMLSITGVAEFSADKASAWLPDFSAAVALRIALRSCDVSASLRARCTVDWRAAFSADFVLAKRKLLKIEWPDLSKKDRQIAAKFAAERKACQCGRRPAGR